ncbi:MAG: hypothetical protein ACOCZ5_00805 [bacterium]
MTTTNIESFFDNLPINVKRILREYQKPIHNNIFYINKRTLREDSDYIIFDSNSWDMRPNVFARDHYGDNFQYVYPVILTVNNLSCMFEFKAEKLTRNIIVTPYLETIFKVLSHRIRTK